MVKILNMSCILDLVDSPCTRTISLKLHHKKKLKTFLGLTGYYRQFVKDYSKIAQPLTDLTHDGAEWVWTNVHQQAFEELRRILVSDQVMNYPDFSKPFIVKSDASISAIGYVLTQQIDGKDCADIVVRIASVWTMFVFG